VVGVRVRGRFDGLNDVVVSVLDVVDVVDDDVSPGLMSVVIGGLVLLIVSVVVVVVVYPVLLPEPLGSR
jgi:hypothetical protein